MGVIRGGLGRPGLGVDGVSLWGICCYVGVRFFFGKEVWRQEAGAK